MTSDPATAWSELMTPTLCMRNPNLRCETFLADHVGHPFQWNGRVPEPMWDDFCDSYGTDLGAYYSSETSDIDAKKDKNANDDKGGAGNVWLKTNDATARKIERHKMYHALKF